MSVEFCSKEARLYEYDETPLSLSRHESPEDRSPGRSGGGRAEERSSHGVNNCTLARRSYLTVDPAVHAVAWTVLLSHDEPSVCTARAGLENLNNAKQLADALPDT